MSTKVLNRCQARWAELLASYDFVLVHIPGIRNPADGPSRRPDYAHDLQHPSGSLIPSCALRLLPPKFTSNLSPLLRSNSALSHDLGNVDITGTSSTSISSSASTSASIPFPPLVLNVLFSSLSRVHAVVAPLPDLRQRILVALQSDSFAQGVSLSSAIWSKDHDGLLLHEGLVYVPASLRAEVISTHHDGPLPGHPGTHRTIQLITRNFWFPSMSSCVLEYIHSCSLCQLSKAGSHVKHGELAPLPVPVTPSKGVTCDFITDLPPSNGKDSVLVFVDRMPKMAHFIPCLKSTSTPDFAQLFIAHVVRLHGLPDSIVSDCGSIFTSKFWSSLASILNIDPRKSTAFHPQTDGQTERTNQTLETYLRIFTNYQQDDWFDLLPLAEFTYNNARHESTKMSPFYANYGYHPRFLAEPISTSVPAADDFGNLLREVHDHLVENVKGAQNLMARYYDAKHKPVEFSPGDLVWLNASNIFTSRPSKKLNYKRLGPFKVLKRIGLQAYKIDLPFSLKHIHDTFHISLLDPYKATMPPHSLPPPLSPVYINDDEQFFEIETILDSRRTRNSLEYLIKWKGYPESDNSWEPSTYLKAQSYIKEFHKRNPSKPGPRRSARVQLVSLLGPSGPITTLHLLH